MRLGSFIHDSNIDITADEMSAFEAMVNESFGDMPVKMKTRNKTWEDVKRDRVVERPFDCIDVRAEITLSLDDDIYGRNFDNQSVQFKSITFQLSNETGHCEDKKDRDVFKGRQYTLWVYVNGSYFNYKSSAINRIETDGCFQYGTELEDMDFGKIRKSLDRYIDFVDMKKSEIKKLKE